ncbi:hypothetical protein [uncultured Agrococcus sp.]|uniref:hypothetical protein n=1 Tax=uncultured Agrococcus sp. TaxID=382258 RepID=UPI0025E442A4|nr:hypothetical protein [uncultured Agrococcus sp.]
MTSGWQHSTAFQGGPLTPERLAKAVDYPYWSPPASFVLDVETGQWEDIAEGDLGPAVSARVPSLAIGSNAAPSQLEWKFRGSVDDPFVVATTVAVRDYDVVFANRISAYGAIPATMVPCPGVTTHLKMVWCTPQQFEFMNRTESLGSGYRHTQLLRTSVESSESIAALLDAYERFDFYEAIAGPLLVGDEPVGIAAVHAEGRSWPSIAQEWALLSVAKATGFPDIPSLLETVTASEEAWMAFNRRMRSERPRIPVAG